MGAYSTLDPRSLAPFRIEVTHLWANIGPIPISIT